MLDSSWSARATKKQTVDRRQVGLITPAFIGVLCVCTVFSVGVRLVEEINLSFLHVDRWASGSESSHLDFATTAATVRTLLGDFRAEFLLLSLLCCKFSLKIFAAGSGFVFSEV